MDHFNTMTKTEMNHTFYNNGKTKDSSLKEEMLNNFYKNDLENRNLETIKLTKLIRNRDNLKIQFKEKINAEVIVNDILRNYNVYGYDCNYMLQSYKDTILILGEKNPDEVKLYKIICRKKEEELNNLINKFTIRDRNNVIKAIEEVESNKICISENIIKKLKELVG